MIHLKDKLIKAQLLHNELFEKALILNQKESEKNEKIKKSLPYKMVINFNIGGKLFQITTETLFSIPNTLFTKLIINLLNNDFLFDEEIFIDRNPKCFSLIIYYYLHKSLPIFKTLHEYEILLIEAKYYEISQLVSYLLFILSEVKFINCIINKPHYISNKVIGTNRVQDLNNHNDRSLQKAICCNYKGEIIIELDKEIYLSKIEVGPYKGDMRWYISNGAGAHIFTSTTKQGKSEWIYVGQLPQNYGNGISIVTLKSSFCKYLRFASLGLIGIGYLRILRD